VPRLTFPTRRKSQDDCHAKGHTFRTPRFIGLPEVLIQTAAKALTGAVRTRQNIQAFSQDPQKVAALRAGVGKMKARTQANRDDPLGWYYWSAVHGTTDDPGNLGNTYNQCEHTRFKPNPLRPTRGGRALHSWHRPFSFFLRGKRSNVPPKRPARRPRSSYLTGTGMKTATCPGFSRTARTRSNPLRHPE